MLAQLCVLFLAIQICITLHARLERGEPPSQDDVYQMEIRMPNITVKTRDAYFCTAKELTEDEAYIIKYEPHASANRVHHMITFGSNTQHSNLTYPEYWDCRNSPKYERLTLMYSWARNAPPLALPKGVGRKIGKNTTVRYIVIQLHYAEPFEAGETDNTGMTLHITKTRQKYQAGLLAMYSDAGVVGPNNPKAHVDINCRFTFDEPIYAFASRVHTHDLGYVVSGYKFSPETKTWTFVGKGNPQWPQSFYPLAETHKISKGEVMAARCTYNTTGRKTPTQMGATNDDEMCNFYLMYYTDTDNGKPFMDCGDEEDYFLSANLPAGNDERLPPNPQLEMMAERHLHQAHVLEFFPKSQSWTKVQEISIAKKGNMGHHSHPQMLDHMAGDTPVEVTQMNPAFKYKEVVDWPNVNVTFGQITAVDVDSSSNIVVFHRGSHVWDGRSFNDFNEYQQVNEGPISHYTVVTLHPAAGHVLRQWGNNLFYLPHGLTLDGKGSVWLTDVALHQVFKFPENGSTKALLTLGERFVPGKDEKHFCKPTSVAISSSGEFYVADGYCNSRVIKFSANGTYLSQWGKNENINHFHPPAGSFYIVHKIILAEDHGLACVADRENGRIQCFTTKDQQFSFEIIRQEFGGRLFSIDYTSFQGGLLYAVCGPSFNHPVMAFVFNLTNQVMLNSFTTNQGTFAQPHDIAVTENSENVYVVEIGPNKLWKFARGAHKSSKKMLDVPAVTASHAMAASTTPHSLQPHMEKHVSASNIVTEASNFATSMVILALLAIPILILILITVVIRLRKRGKLQHCSLSHVKGWLGGYRTPHSQDKFNIGNLLNPHKGFDRVALDESDVEGEEGSDSDIEEFNATVTKKA